MRRERAEGAGRELRVALISHAGENDDGPARFIGSERARLRA